MPRRKIQLIWLIPGRNPCFQFSPKAQHNVWIQTVDCAPDNTSIYTNNIQHISDPTEDMEAKKIPEVILNSGQKMPVIGLGTASIPLPPHEALTSIPIVAFEVGYRHFDTASLYGSEESLGKAVAQALDLGLIKSRDKVFITSKLWTTDAHPDLVVPTLKTHCRKYIMFNYSFDPYISTIFYVLSLTPKSCSFQYLHIHFLLYVQKLNPSSF